jgi:pectin lyase
MKISLLILGGALAANAQVRGRPEGFANGATGGGSAACAAPASLAQLTTWLTDKVARCILINREWNYMGSEGRRTETGCRPTSSCGGNGGQDAINANNYCSTFTPAIPSVQVNYDVAGTNAIVMGSNKSLVGVGASAVIRGRGLRIVNARNIIIQNIHFTQINPEYIWGGDAIGVQTGADLVWIGKSLSD